MATIKSIKILRNRGVRPNDNVIYMGRAWYVEKGEPYDLVQFSINELGKPYFWDDSLCMPAGMSEDDIRKAVEDYAKNISDQDIKRYQEFLRFGEKWGWD